LRLWLLVALLLGVAGATAALVESVSSSSVSFADRLAEIGDLLAGGTLLLALIAAAVALIAYANATGLPHLEFKICFEFSEPNRPAFRASITENGWLKANTFKQTMGTISLQNTSGYTARNPAVIVRFNGMAFLPGQYSASREWVTIAFANTIGITAVQWDGGPSYAIHGHSVRFLPTLDLHGLQHVPDWGDPSLSFVLLADGGYRREVKVPVDFIVDGESRFLKNGFKLPTTWI
jgi:hypothetical protein